MKLEWLLQLVVLMLFYLDNIIEVDYQEISFSEMPGIDFLFLLYHATLFYFVNYVLIPKFFYPKKHLLFALSLVGIIVVYGVVEEGIVEQILTPNSRGRNPVDLVSIYWFFGEMLVPLLAFMSIKFMFDNFEQRQRAEQIEKDNIANELKFLKSQIQPHILFNSLNNLYNFTLIKSDKSPDLVLKLSNVLRYVLYETTAQKVTLKKEMKFVEDYVDLQEMQFEGRGQISFKKKIDISINERQIAPFLLVPFIENGVKHSLSSMETGIVLTIEIEVERDRLQLWVENNFEEIPKSNEELIYQGIGLENVQKRLQLLYPGKHKLQFHRGADIFKVHLDLVLAE